MFPPNAIIPLHDHPGMCVLSRVLYGEIQKLSLDLVKKEETTTAAAPASKTKSWFSSFLHPTTTQTKTAAQHQRATRKTHTTLRAPSVTILYPYEGNLHEFQAGPHGAAVLDVLLPPYNEHHDRECTFYELQQEEKNAISYLVPIGQPDDFSCLSGKYMELGEG